MSEGLASVWVIVVAAGRSSRFGGPKQLAIMGGRRVLDWSLSTAASVADGVVLVLPRNQLSDDRNDWGADYVVAGGATRSDSVRAGLAVVPDEAGVIVVHDGARPLASTELFRAVIDALDHESADGAVPGLAVTETLKRVEGGRVESTLDRTALVAVQTPQAFRAQALRGAHAGRSQATDDAVLIEDGGGVVVVVPGETTNIKLTVPVDLRVAQAMMEP